MKRFTVHEGLEALGDRGLLEFENRDAIAERGYSAAAEPLRAWWTTQQSRVDAR